MTTKSTPFKSLLVANRGEIACRIIRTASLMGIRTVAIYSEADAEAPHVAMADDARLIGPSPVSESYLVGDKVLDIARTTGAEAIHPGYGFLSENAGFAKACTDAGIIFVGPNADAINLMGDKAKAKRRMIDAGLPCVPGYQDEDQSDAALFNASKNIGFPLMVKAAAGGGGRGMRLVHDADNLPNAIKTARSEAINAFGSGDLILERAIIEPRHVEIQIFADKYGHTIHLGERDCSVQRRHQKVLEEAPCPVMTPELRSAMGNAAVKAARDIGYIGAGTVEFLLDASGAFYFLEMNTRLQVEHPVTEMITGLDLVAMQIRVARGDTLSVTQEDISLSGHAIEARLYAEDVSQDFLPATGSIDLWKPATGDGIRIDAGIASGGEVSPFYDPMIAKVIAHGASREEARCKLIDTLKRTAIFGVTTNKKFLVNALEKQKFADGHATTAFITENFPDDELSGKKFSTTLAVIAAVLQHRLSQQVSLAFSPMMPKPLLNWTSASKISTPYRYDKNDNILDVFVLPQSQDFYKANIGDAIFHITIEKIDLQNATLKINDQRQHVLYNSGKTAEIQLSVDGQDINFINLNAVFASSADIAGAGSVIAPMHGLLLEVIVAQGDNVKKGDRLAILEAMKMQHELLAEVDGVVSEITCEPGKQVAADSLLMEITEQDG